MKLVKRIFVVSFFVLLTKVTYGQVQIDLGVKGGVNFANINSLSPVVSTYGEQTGYHGGAYAMFKFSDVALQSELIYSSEGQSYKYVQPGYPTLKSTFNYLNVPILLKVYVAGGFNLQAGPQFGFLLNSTGYTYISSSTGPVVTSQPLGDYVRAFNASFGVGVGLDLPFGLNFTLRYNGGLSDINKMTGTNLSSGLSSAFGTRTAKSEVVQVSVGYRLFKFGA